jgi:hypothetical protein
MTPPTILCHVNVFTLTLPSNGTVEVFMKSAVERGSGAMIQIFIKTGSGIKNLMVRYTQTAR